MWALPDRRWLLALGWAAVVALGFPPFLLVAVLTVLIHQSPWALLWEDPPAPAFSALPPSLWSAERLVAHEGAPPLWICVLERVLVPLWTALAREMRRKQPPLPPPYSVHEYEFERS